MSLVLFFLCAKNKVENPSNEPAEKLPTLSTSYPPPVRNDQTGPSLLKFRVAQLATSWYPNQPSFPDRKQPINGVPVTSRSDYHGHFAPYALFDDCQKEEEEKEEKGDLSTCSLRRW